MVDRRKKTIFFSLSNSLVCHTCTCFQWLCLSCFRVMTIVVAVLKVEASVRGKLANVNASILIMNDVQCSQLSNNDQYLSLKIRMFCKRSYFLSDA